MLVLYWAENSKMMRKEVHASYPNELAFLEEVMKLSKAKAAQYMTIAGRDEAWITVQPVDDNIDIIIDHKNNGKMSYRASTFNGVAYWYKLNPVRSGVKVKYWAGKAIYLGDCLEANTYDGGSAHGYIRISDEGNQFDGFIVEVEVKSVFP